MLVELWAYIGKVYRCVILIVELNVNSLEWGSIVHLIQALAYITSINMTCMLDYVNVW